MDTIPNGIRRALNKSKSPLGATQVFVNTTNHIFFIYIYKNSKTIFSKSMHGGVMDGFLEGGVMDGTYL